MESATFVRARVVSPFWKSSSVCRLKDEKVVKPPSRPIITKFRVKSPERIPAQTPMANEPAMFTKQRAPKRSACFVADNAAEPETQHAAERAA